MHSLADYSISENPPNKKSARIINSSPIPLPYAQCTLALSVDPEPRQPHLTYLTPPYSPPPPPLRCNNPSRRILGCAFLNRSFHLYTAHHVEQTRSGAAAVPASPPPEGRRYKRASIDSFFHLSYTPLTLITINNNNSQLQDHQHFSTPPLLLLHITTSLHHLLQSLLQDSPLSSSPLPLLTSSHEQGASIPAPPTSACPSLRHHPTQRLHHDLRCC